MLSATLKHKPYNHSSSLKGSLAFQNQNRPTKTSSIQINTKKEMQQYFL